MTPSLFRALRGPIFLIGLGLLFAADQMGTFSLAQTWPALLILFGGLKLLERFAYREPRPENPPPGPYMGGTFPGGTSQSGGPQ